MSGSMTMAAGCASARRAGRLGMVLAAALALLTGACQPMRPTVEAAPPPVTSSRPDIPTGPAPIVPGQQGTQTAQPPAPPPQPSPQPAIDPAAMNREVKVGLLLPLSTSIAGVRDIAADMADAAQLSLFQLGVENIVLLPQDTRGTPDGAAAAANAALDQGAEILIGPFFRTSVSAVRPIAAARGVPSLAFTTDWTTAGDTTYVMGFLPFEQVARIVGFAQRQGVQRFGGIARQDQYGDAVLAKLVEQASLGGAEVTKTARFDEQTDLDAMMRAFTEAERRAGTGATDLPYQAVLLPLGPGAIGQVAQLFPFHGVPMSQVRLLGTGLWDEPAVWRELALQGGWYAAPAPEARRAFEAAFQENFGRQPQRLASLAYDATNLVTQLALIGLRERGQPAFDAASLTNPRGFAGTEGIFRFRPDNLIERGLAVLEVQPDGPRVLDAAPTSFAPPATAALSGPSFGGGVQAASFTPAR